MFFTREIFISESCISESERQRSRSAPCKGTRDSLMHRCYILAVVGSRIAERSTRRCLSASKGTASTSWTAAVIAIRVLNWLLLAVWVASLVFVPGVADLCPPESIGTTLWRGNSAHRDTVCSLHRLRQASLREPLSFSLLVWNRTTVQVAFSKHWGLWHGRVSHSVLEVRTSLPCTIVDCRGT